MAQQQKRTSGKHVVFSVGIALVAFVAFALLGKEKPASNPLATEQQAKSLTKTAENTAQNAANSAAELAKLPGANSKEKPLLQRNSQKTYKLN